MPNSNLRHVYKKHFSYVSRRFGRIWQSLNQVLTRAKDNIFEKHKTGYQKTQNFMLIGK
jgi:hypothetical protein